MENYKNDIAVLLDEINKRLNTKKDLENLTKKLKCDERTIRLMLKFRDFSFITKICDALDIKMDEYVDIKRLNKRFDEQLINEYSKLNTQYKLTLISYLESAIKQDFEKCTFQPSDALIDDIKEKLHNTSINTVARNIALRVVQRRYKALYNKTRNDQKEIDMETKYYNRIIGKLLTREINSYLAMKKLCFELDIDINKYIDAKTKDKLNTNIMPVLSQMDLKQKDDYLDLAEIFRCEQEERIKGKKLTIN